jgi:hypothetical protein
MNPLSQVTKHARKRVSARSLLPPTMCRMHEGPRERTTRESDRGRDGDEGRSDVRFVGEDEGGKDVADIRESRGSSLC